RRPGGARRGGAGGGGVGSTKEREANTNVTLRGRAPARGRLEGWPQAPNVLPSFETLRASRRAPQDDGVACCAGEFVCWWITRPSGGNPPYTTPISRSFAIAIGS